MLRKCRYCKFFLNENPRLVYSLEKIASLQIRNALEKEHGFSSKRTKIFRKVTKQKELKMCKMFYENCKK